MGVQTGRAAGGGARVGSRQVSVPARGCGDEGDDDGGEAGVPSQAQVAGTSKGGETKPGQGGEGQRQPG